MRLRILKILLPLAFCASSFTVFTSCNKTSQNQFEHYQLHDTISGELPKSYQPQICDVVTDIYNQNITNNFTVNYKLECQDELLSQHLKLYPGTSNKTSMLKLLPGLLPNDQTRAEYRYSIITTAECEGK